MREHLVINRIFSAPFFRWLVIVTAASMAVAPVIGVVTGFGQVADLVLVAVSGVVVMLPVVFSDVGFLWWDLRNAPAKENPLVFDKASWVFYLIRWAIAFLIAAVIIGVLPSPSQSLAPGTHYGILIPVAILETVFFLAISVYLGARWLCPRVHDRMLGRYFPKASQRLYVNATSAELGKS